MSKKTKIVVLADYRKAKQDAERDMISDLEYEEVEKITQEASETLSEFYSDLSEIYDYFINNYKNITEIELQSMMYLFIQQKTLGRE